MSAQPAVQNADLLAKLRLRDDMAHAVACHTDSKAIRPGPPGGQRMRRPAASDVALASTDRATAEPVGRPPNNR